MKLSDKQIRDPLYSFIESASNRIRILEELRIDNSRADLLVVTDGILTGYEVKSDLDSYTCLKTQTADYSRFCDYCYAVIGRSHQQGILERIPEFWGVLVVVAVATGVNSPPLDSQRDICESSIKVLRSARGVEIDTRTVGVLVIVAVALTGKGLLAPK